jgi:hypothetical protein
MINSKELIKGTRDKVKIGQIFGNLEIISFAGFKGTLDGHRKLYKVPYWNAKCLFCNSVIIVSEYNLTSGNTKSCGCQRYKNSLCKYAEKVRSGEIKAHSAKGESNGNYKHGWNNTKLINIYKGMIQRCYSKNNSSYKNYGARGIKVCDEWLGENGFINFKNWSLNNGYIEGEDLSIDRANVNKGYSPDNCTWAGRGSKNWHRQQGNNTTTNHIVEWAGVQYTITELAQHFGYNPDYIYYRLGA